MIESIKAALDVVEDEHNNLDRLKHFGITSEQLADHFRRYPPGSIEGNAHRPAGSGTQRKKVGDVPKVKRRTRQGNAGKRVQQHESRKK